MNNKKILIILNLAVILLISFLYKNAEVINNRIFIFAQEFDMHSNSIEIKKSLIKQNYLLKIKYLKQDGQDKIIAFNNHILTPYRMKKKLIETNLLLIPRDLVKDNNTLTITFKDKYPADIDVRFSNCRILLNGDMVVFLDKKILKKDIRGASLVFIILLASFMVFIWFIGLFWRADSKRIIYSAFLSFLPFSIFLIIINVISFFFNFQISISPLFIKLWMPLTFFAAFMVMNLKFRANGKLSVLFSNILVFLLILCISEIITRAYIRFHYPANIFKLSSPDISYQMVPNFNGDFAGSKVILNSQGLRDTEHYFKKEAGVYRILCLGDSIVFGYGAAQPDIFTSQLQKILPHNKTMKYEVINAAVTGYNTYQERVSLEKFGIKYNPDLVIVGFTMNDLTAGMLSPSMLHTLMDIKGEPYSYADMAFSSRLQYFLLRRSYFFQYCLLKFRSLLNTYKLNKIVMVGDYSKESLDYYAGLLAPEKLTNEYACKKELLKLKDLTRGSKLLLIIFSADIQLRNEKFNEPQKMIRAFCQENKISFIDMLPVFKKYTKKEIFVDIGHPNAFGHKLVVEEILKYLKDNRIIN